MSFCHFEGPPCLRHNNYVFYKAFKYKCDYQYKVLALGDFFFLKILQEISVCIGEVELLWEDKTSNQFLASLRLYFRPEHTPNGRQDDTGEDEVIALGERLVLKLDDLVPLIQHGVRWTYGCPTYCPKGAKSMPKNGDIHDEKELTSLKNCGHGVVGHEGNENGIVSKNAHTRKRNLSYDHAQSDSVASNNAISGAANLAVMSYPRYCRYRAVRRRLEGCDNEWIHLAVVVAIGGFKGRAPGCRVMFCRDTFYQSEIDDLDIRMDHMLPVLKARCKGKKSRQLSRKDSQQDSDSMEEMFANVTPSVSSSSRPRRSTESSEVGEEKVSTEEQAFLIGLHKFMHEAQMPIGRIPSLGFKQNLYYFYQQAEKLGGYDSITHKRMWKHLYDKLGGNSSNTSAATCTRKHYERLLLPYERHLRKLKVRKVRKKPQKQVDSGSDVKSAMDSDRTVRQITENVDVKVKSKSEVKAEPKSEVKVEPKSEVKLEVLEQDDKENLRQSIRESPQSCCPESTTCEEKPLTSVMEHSKSEVQIEEPEVIEVPVVRQSIPGNTQLPSFDVSDVASSNSLQNQSVSQKEPQQVVKAPTVLTPTRPSGSFLLGEKPAVPYANVVYTGGYLVPVLSPILQTPWGVITSPSTPTSVPAASTVPTTPTIPVLHTTSDGVISQPGNRFKDHSNTPPSLSTMKNQDFPSQDTRKPQTKKQALPFQLPSSLPSDVQKVAHTNTPYKPSPYLLNDHIQPVRKISRSSHHFSQSESLVNSSHYLASMLHPKPPGHRNQSHLPPAPTTIYLHPTSTNPFSPLQPATVSTPPSAHCHPRKRIYPFECPTSLSTGLFPSPDMVLDRIRNSTGLPRSTLLSTPANTQQQRFEDPRQIFTQTTPSVVASQSLSVPQRKEPHVRQEVANSNLPSTKSKNSKKSHHSYTVYSQMSSPELQQALMVGHVDRRSSNNTKIVEQRKPANSLNGLHSSHQTSNSVTSFLPVNPVPSSSKDGRLMSALFGTQFTALPRNNKPSEPTPAQSLLTDPASAVMSLSPHLHPAFMSPYLPAAGSTHNLPARNSQLQMLASALVSPSQRAAYDEMLRQNGCGAFLAAATAHAKMSKKN